MATYETSSIRKCFISAPARAHLDVLRQALRSRGVSVLVPQDLTAGTDWSAEISKEIQRADLVIGVLPSAQPTSPWVLFELGQASALGRRIVLITSPKSEPIPFALHRMLVLRIDLDNADAIGFALDQILSAPSVEKSAPVSPQKALTRLGPEADVLRAKLDQALAADNELAVSEVVGKALRASGVDVVVDSTNRESGPDFAIWSDVLESFVGNPFLIEIKLRIRSKRDADEAATRLAQQIAASNSRWGLLLYGEGPESESDIWNEVPINVLSLPLRGLLVELRNRAFPEVVRDLRNRRVHGILP
jgi:hypothetical protein